MYVLGIIKIMSRPKKTPANSSQPEPKPPVEIERKLLSTGLEDYGFWSQEMARQKAQQTEPDKPFRRGRIWC
ncbi:cyanobactin biosynthesis PatC/TenC/TruC family protein [Anabaena aphanizomenioides LEGE 00250]|uniref:Cyanobactin biosynthesis PatC/TenC/TruC family protein n=2 Tax=Sphaerospermopsis aphanizomenoides TaxID=459663 RepID=A0ABR9VD51_9CYAN|nr:cyanobactin biosynthesis PatC/TenC/TruC family protein [Sphaerospermopsis aphanizomenoides LEGE 00250]